MIVAVVLDPSVLKWGAVRDHWWQWILFGIIFVSAALGTAYIIYSVTVRTIKRFKSKPKKDVVSTRAQQSLKSFSSQVVPRAKSQVSKTSSFGVYLGDFSSQPTQAQQAVLQRSDLVVLNPFRHGVHHAIDGLEGRHFLGRLDLATLLAGESTSDETVDRIGEIIVNTLIPSSFTGVLLAGWETELSVAYLEAVTHFIDALGLIVYLETAPPKFLPNGDVLGNTAIAGIIIRNAAIIPDGQHRDYFDMEFLQPTVRAFVKESCLRPFTVLAWESLDEEAVASNAVIKRAMRWCGFYSAMTWIGSAAALEDAEQNLAPIEPFGAFEWLKDETVMKAHSTWKNSTTMATFQSSDCADQWDQVARSFPEAEAFRASNRKPSEVSATSDASTLRASTISTPTLAHRSIKSISELTTEYVGLGCFPLGVEVTPLAFAEVLQAQIRLRNLGLLQPVDTQKITNMGITFRKFHDRHMTKVYEDSPHILDAVKEVSLLAKTAHLKIHIGLSPGFGHGRNARFWAVQHSDSDGTEVFVSRDAQGLAGTVLHAVLADLGIARDMCFEIETVFAQWSEDVDKQAGLPIRMVQDIDLLTPEERLLLLQQLTLSHVHNNVIENVRTQLRWTLLDCPSKALLNELDSVDYLNGDTSAFEMLQARFDWYDEHRVSHPDLMTAVVFFRSLEKVMISMFRNRQEAELKAFNLALTDIVSQPEMDAWADILGLASFSAARKAALDEVYLEVTDRNPLWNDHPDQAAVFSESFALGSRCEAYFDVAPSVFGKILHNRYRTHYTKKQPPLWNNGAPDFATAYGGAQIDVDPKRKVKALPEFQRFGFLSVFAIPALVDIALLTTIGRGLYLSAFMTLQEQQAATVALMVSLLLSGATGTWIACGGSYYLVSMAFSAMNVFVLSRLIGGLALTLLASVFGFFAMTGASGIKSGIVFFLYLFGFTTYLSLFAAIASFQFPGTSFLSGRKVIIFCLPWLLISPIITIWAQHDIIVYLSVFYFVLVVLFFALRHIGSRWVTWYQGLQQTNDSEIRQWYTTSKAAGDPKVLSAMTDPAALKVAREALLEAVEAETSRGMFTKPTSDKVVHKLATNYTATNFLLDWYCRYSDVPRPIPYSSSWNIQTKVALQTLCDAQKGIRLHSGFIHWRQAGDEVGCGILYFILALLDKWVEMLTGTHLVGLSQSLNDEFRMAVGFGLAYYLIGAVLIDIKAQELHGAVNISTPEGIRTPQELRHHRKREMRIRRGMYTRTLFRFLAWHCWGLVFTTTLVWVFQATPDAMYMFLSYVTAYTGLLWYQYTKIFSGPFALKPLLTAVALGLPLGIALKKSFPAFRYSGVTALGIATWTAAILCLLTAKLGMPKKPSLDGKLGETFKAYTKPWADPEWSQEELRVMYENLETIPSEARFAIIASQHPGSEVKAILSHRYTSQVMERAFPDFEDMIDLALKAWESGQIVVEIVSLGKLGNDLRAISFRTASKINLVIGVSKGAELQVNMRNNCQIIAELLLHEVAEAYFKMPHDHATLAEHLVNDELPLNIRQMLAEENDHQLVAAWSKKEVLKQHCLGLDCDLYWDRLSQATREYFLKRCLGETCMISESEERRLSTVLCKSANEDLNVHVARCDLAIEVAIDMIDFASARLWSRAPHKPEPLEEEEPPSFGIWHHVKRPFSHVYHTIGITVKYFVVAIVADAEWQREFHHRISKQHAIIRVPTEFILNSLWSYARAMQNIGLSFFLFHNRPKMQSLWEEVKGPTVTLRPNKVDIQTLKGAFTAFKRPDAHGEYKLYRYKGTHKTEPTDNQNLLVSVSAYSANNELRVKEDFKDGESTNLFEYEYDDESKEKNVFSVQGRRIPHTRRCVRGPKYLESVSYNSKGLVDAGSHMTGGNLMHFKLSYRKNARFHDELLRGEFVMAHLSANVSWCAPPRRHAEKLETWIPHAKVTKATFTQGPDEYESKWTYDHKFHPTIDTTMNGKKVQTPPMIEHDWLSVLKKPKHESFADEDPLFHFNKWNSNLLARYLGYSRHRIPISTSLARSRIWKAWKSTKDLDGVVARWLDEKLIRNDEILAPYWRLRNHGNLEAAKKYLSSRADAVMSSADLDEEISSWTPLAMKLGDLYSFGPGGDTIVHTRAKNVGKDTNETLHVLAADNGTWPNEGGGVSACRRDMINSLETIKWHMLCESATDFGVPKHQTEQNVLSLKVIPLWGLDFLTPTHGLFKNKLDSEVDMLQSSATDLEIKRNFIPTLTALVQGARAIDFSSADLQRTTRAFVNLHDYFQDKRHWSEVWKSDVTKDAWRALWLDDTMPNAKPPSEWLDTELPTIGHFETALELWLRYLFVFSIQVPEKIPAIFQASHHSVSAAYGVVCKIKRKCQLQIWDHAIAWRETNMCLSSALCKLPPFVRNSLLGLTKMTSVLVLHHADVILPCADFFNPGWEIEVGTCQGTIEHRNSFKRKISPIVNGITDAEKFQPVKEITTKKPTVTMLSHLWFCKDLKTAILAADIIVNEWGFKDYQLDVYGSIEKAPIYSNECQELIASKALRGSVKLCGSADPLKVLEQTWLFMNSSLSEGLPLALGEAALTGAPVVCTDVGASLRVLSDPDDFSRYSAVVAPNDARALARAQIKMLGMLEEFGEWADDVGPSPVLPFSPTAEDVERITARMYEKSDHRRKLGMKSRTIVQKSFSGERYLREHEQMLWIGKSRKMMESRTHGELSDDPADIAHTLRLNAAVNEEVIPQADAASFRPSSVMSFGGSMYDRSATPVITEEWTELIGKTARSMHMSSRPVSRMSVATTDTDFSVLKPSGMTQQMTALPRLNLDVPTRRSSWQKNTKITLSALQDEDLEKSSGFSSTDAHTALPTIQYNNRPATPTGITSVYSSAFESRFRGSDISLVAMNNSSDANSIMNMEPPPNMKKESAYRNLTPTPGHESPSLAEKGFSGGFGRNSPALERPFSPIGGRRSPMPPPPRTASPSGRMSPGIEKMHSSTNFGGRYSPALARGRSLRSAAGTRGQMTEKRYFT